MSPSETQGISIGKLEDFEDETPKRIDIDEHRLCVVRHQDQFYAMDDLCTHGHAFLTDGYFDADECVMECPLHGGLFDAKTGEACGEPATRPVRVYPIQIRDQEVYVELE